MNETIDIQLATEKTLPFSKKILRKWVKTALGETYKAHELTLRFVDKAEIQDLNRTYRQQDKPTNVLAFPSEIPDEIKKIHPFLGDVIICPDILQEESEANATPLEAHWAHIVIHGTLHLLGYDHIEMEEAEIMQSLETQLLSTLGFSNPYATEDDDVEKKK